MLDRLVATKGKLLLQNSGTTYNIYLNKLIGVIFVRNNLNRVTKFSLELVQHLFLALKHKTNWCQLWFIKCK